VSALIATDRAAAATTPMRRRHSMNAICCSADHPPARGGMGG
jgi:hypothetical protein